MKFTLPKSWKFLLYISLVKIQKVFTERCPPSIAVLLNYGPISIPHIRYYSMLGRNAWIWITTFKSLLNEPRLFKETSLVIINFFLSKIDAVLKFLLKSSYLDESIYFVRFSNCTLWIITQILYFKQKIWSSQYLFQFVLLQDFFREVIALHKQSYVGGNIICYFCHATVPFVDHAKYLLRTESGPYWA